MFYKTIKEILDNIPNKSNFLKDLNLPTSYLGVRYFLSGKQEKLGGRGLDALLEKLGYKMVLLPIKKDQELPEEIEKLQAAFFNDLEEYSKKFAGDTKRVKTVVSKEDNIITDKLMDLDTKSSITVDGVDIDLGIEADDLF